MIKSYQQTLDYTCGAAVVRTLLGIHAMKVPSEKRLAVEMRATSTEGISPENLLRALTNRGFWGFVGFYDVPMLCRTLKHGEHPIIDWADWGGHWVLITEYRKLAGWSGGQFTLADPAAKYEGRPDGFTYVSADRLDSMWFSPIGGEKRLCIIVRGEDKDAEKD